MVFYFLTAWLDNRDRKRKRKPDWICDNIQRKSFRNEGSIWSGYQDKVVLITGAGDVAEAAAKRLLCEGARCFSDSPRRRWTQPISGLKAEGGTGSALWA